MLDQPTIFAVESILIKAGKLFPRADMFRRFCDLTSPLRTKPPRADWSGISNPDQAKPLLKSDF
jgi:hypothetical protein